MYSPQQISVTLKTEIRCHAYDGNSNGNVKKAIG